MAHTWGGVHQRLNPAVRIVEGRNIPTLRMLRYQRIHGCTVGGGCLTIAVGISAYPREFIYLYHEIDEGLIQSIRDGVDNAIDVHPYFLQHRFFVLAFVLRFFVLIDGKAR